MKTASAWSGCAPMLENKVVGHVLQIASQTGDEEEEVVVLEEETLNLPVSEECRMNVSMVIATLHDNLNKKDKGGVKIRNVRSQTEVSVL